MTDPFARLHPGVQYHLANTLRWDGLRPTQAAAVAPILDGKDVLLLAPTAGGKTEAALFPLLTAMTENRWDGVSVLYVCPLRALLNNLHPRVQGYCRWLGRDAAVWHGDVGHGARARILTTRPDVLLTTPESLEAMLVSTKVEERQLFAGLRAVVVDEVHAFAADDRGWHLLAVLERLARVAGRELQRVGLSATVGNPEALLVWLQGGSGGGRARAVVAPAADPAATPEVTVDYVATLENAATVVAALHQGQKRLVFVDSRRAAEQLGAALRAKGVDTHLSHSSLSAAQRRAAETAFADARDTVIVATSTLELGVDIGDLDRVIHIDAPRTVASFLQRLGRTGRRPGTRRNCLFLCLGEDTVLRTLGLLRLWSHGWVEPVTAPPAPRHIAAQQILALTLQERRVGSATWRDRWGGLGLFDDSAEAILGHLVREGYLDADGPLLHIGPEAERRFGRRHFTELTAVFSAPPEFTVLQGRVEVGTVGTSVLVDKADGPRRLLLAGRSWTVTHIDWKRRRCFVEPADSGGKARWSGTGSDVSHALARAMRAVAAGEGCAEVTLTRRAEAALAAVRAEYAAVARPGRTVLEPPERWWTWAGTAANRVLQASLPTVVDPRQRVGEKALRLLPGVGPAELGAALAGAALRPPEVSPDAVRGLKFADALPPGLAAETLALRLGDLDGARAVVGEGFVVG